MINRRISRIIVALAVAGLGVLGLSSPANADTPTISYTNICGGVKITVSGVTSIAVSRDGALIATVDDDVSYWGAAPGDIITVAGFEGSHTYSNPAGCDFPAVEFSYEPGCQGIVTLHVNNSGTVPLSGFAWQSSFSDDLGDLPVGNSTHYLTAEGEFALVQPRDGGDVVWLYGIYKEPRSCGPTTAEAKFTDTCGKVKLVVKSSVTEVQGVLVTKNGAIVDIGFFTSDAPFTESYDAVAGDEFAVYYPVPGEEQGPEATLRLKTGAAVNPATEGFVKLAEHEHTPPACGDLPVTGVKIGAAVAAGMLLIGAGAALFVVSRRRRITSV